MRIDISFATDEEKAAVLASIGVVIAAQGVKAEAEDALKLHLETTVKQLYVRGKLLAMEQSASKTLSTEADSLFVKTPAAIITEE